MHILYIIGQGEGGLPHYTAELANAVAHYADVTVMKPATTTADGEFDDAVEILEPFRSIDISMSKLYDRTADLLAFLRGIQSYDRLERVTDMDVDLIHEPTGLFPHVKLFARRHNIDHHAPFVVTRHEVPKPRFSPSRPPVMVEEIVSSLLPDLAIDRTIVHTKTQRNALSNRGVDPERIEVVPHGAYTLFDNPRPQTGEPEPDTVLFFGNLVPPKGIDTFVRAVPLVAQQSRDFTALIAGDGRVPDEVRPILETHPDCFEVHNRFIPNDEVAEFFERAQLVVMPYRNQRGTKGHSGVLSIAFSFGKPVVASSAGVFPEYVDREGCGVTVPPEDPPALARAIRQLLRDDDRRREMAVRSRKMADQLSWDNIADRHLEIYRSIVEETLTQTPVDYH